MNVGTDTFDNVLKGQDREADVDTTTTQRSGHITLGKFADGFLHGELTVDLGPTAHRARTESPLAEQA